MLHKMFLKQLIVITVLSACVSFCDKVENMHPNEQISVTYFSGGDAATVDYNDETAELVKTIENLLAGADDILELIVDDQMIDEMRSSECIEIIFPNPRSLDIGGRIEQEVKRILIPLIGEYADGDSITFFWGGQVYSSGPYVKFTGLSELREAIQKILP